MKRILLILAVASLLFACDKTENEQDILNTFIGYASISMNVQTLDATGVQSSYATLRGSVALKETDKTIDASGFYISASPDPLETGTIMEGPTTVFVDGKAEFTKQVGNLQPNTPYYYVAFARYHDQTEYGTEKIFTTITPPEIAVADGLVVYYTFDNEDGRERQGKTRYDGVATGIPEFTPDIPGSSGKAIELAGNTYDQYYEISPTPFKEAMENSEHDPNVEIAVNFWMKTDNRQQTIYTHHASYSTNEVIPRLEIRSNSGVGVFMHFMDSQYRYLTQYDPTPILDSQWHMLTLVYVYPSDVKIYADGQMVENGGWWSNMHTDISGDYPFRLGEDFTGKLDNFRVYDRVLTEVEIYELFITRQ